jgi:hypothetical protein
MTARRRLPPLAEIREVLDFLKKEYGINPALSTIDIRADGVAVSPPVATPGNAYDAWKTEDKGRDRPARRQ